jgi:hypothetical protein
MLSTRSHKGGTMVRHVGAVILTVAMIGPAFSQEDCSRALIVAQTRFSSDEIKQLSSAYNLSEYEYNKHKQDYGINVVIYGIPIGANYNDFKESIRRKAESLRIDNFERRSIAYATSGLDANSLRAYQSCLVTRGGLSVVVKELASSFYVLSVIHRPLADVPNLRGRAATRNINADDEQRLIADLSQKTFGTADLEYSLAPVDPRAEASVTVTVGNTSRTVLMPPLLVPPRPAPRGPTYRWRLVRTGDCGGRDIGCSTGPQPLNNECTQDRVGFTSVCFTNNPGKPNYPGCAGQPQIWCTYKSVLQAQCVGGGQAGSLYECVRE